MSTALRSFSFFMLLFLSISSASLTINLINPANNSNQTENITFQFSTNGDDPSYYSNISVIGFGYIATNVLTANNTTISIHITGAPLGPAVWHTESWNTSSGDYNISDDYNFTVIPPPPIQFSIDRSGIANSGKHGDGAIYSLRGRIESQPAFPDAQTPTIVAHAGFFPSGAFFPPIPPIPPVITYYTRHTFDTLMLDMSGVAYLSLLAFSIFLIIRKKKDDQNKEDKDDINGDLA